MIDDEPRRRAQAARTGTAHVAVAAHHEQRGVLSSSNDFVLNASHPRGRRARRPQAFGGRCEQPGRVVGGEIVQPTAGITGRVTAEQPGDLRWIFQDHTEVELRRMTEEPSESPYFGKSFLWTALFRLP